MSLAAGLAVALVPKCPACPTAFLPIDAGIAVLTSTAEGLRDPIELEPVEG